MSRIVWGWTKYPPIDGTKIASFLHSVYYFLSKERGSGLPILRQRSLTDHSEAKIRYWMKSAYDDPNCGELPFQIRRWSHEGSDFGGIEFLPDVCHRKSSSLQSPRRLNVEYIATLIIKLVPDWEWLTAFLCPSLSQQVTCEQSHTHTRTKLKHTPEII